MDPERTRHARGLFAGIAPEYDRMGAALSFGQDPRWRRFLVSRVNAIPGSWVLDVATGTGLVARAATAIVRERGAVIGLDPSAGMLRQGRQAHSALLVQGTVEALPFGDGDFDFVSMGYALRHMADLRVAFTECRRVLKPGGRLLVLEISQPRSLVGGWLARAYLERILPFAMRLAGSAQAALLMKYHWDTIAACVPPDAILEVLRVSGFAPVERRVRCGLLSEYLGVRPPA